MLLAILTVLPQQSFTKTIMGIKELHDWDRLEEIEIRDPAKENRAILHCAVCMSGKYSMALGSILPAQLCVPQIF